LPPTPCQVNETGAVGRAFVDHKSDDSCAPSYVYNGGFRLLNRLFQRLCPLLAVLGSGVRSP
jgi:hypothetical protein